MAGRNPGLNRIRGVKAFTLIEIMIAVIVLSIGIISLMYLFPLSLRYSIRARILTQGAFLAQGLLEEELSRPSLSPLSQPSGDLGPEFPDYSYTMEKTPWEGSWALYSYKVSVFHNINNKETPVVTLRALKGAAGDLQDISDVP